MLCSRTFDDTIAAIQDQAASLQTAQQRLQEQAQLAQEQLQRLHSARTTDLAEVWQQLDGKADMDTIRKATSGLTSGSLVQQVGQGELGGASEAASGCSTAQCADGLMASRR